MTDERRAWRDAAAVRAEFDAAFARREAPPEPTAALLAVRVGSEPLALRVLDVAGLVPIRHVMAVPSRRPELLGVVGLRGEVVPLFGLARLVHGRPDESPRWMVLAGGSERVAFAFTTFDGHLRVPVAELRSAPGEPSVRHVRELYTGSPPRPVLDMSSLVAAATARDERESP